MTRISTSNEMATLADENNTLLQTTIELINLGLTEAAASGNYVTSVFIPKDQNLQRRLAVLLDNAGLSVALTRGLDADDNDGIEINFFNGSNFN